MTDFDIPVYEKEFSAAVEAVASTVEAWVHAGPDAVLDIDQFSDCVYLKLSSRIIANANLAYQQFFGGKNQAQGFVGDGFLDEATMGVSVKSDELLISSGKVVEFEHISTGPGGKSFHIRTHKRWISHNRRGLSILGVSRVIARIDKGQLPTAESLAIAAKKFDSLDADDRALCCLMAAGHSQREMAELLGCTTRTIENRRNRIMEELGATKPIEIVKLMVRLAEHGLIPADF